LPALVAVIKHNLKKNVRCVYLNSPPMVAGLRSYLFAAEVDVPKEISKGSLVLSSDRGYLQNGTFDVERMLGVLGDAMEQAVIDGYEGLWATGDMSWEFGPAKDFSKLLEYEWRLEAFLRQHPTLSGICQYHIDSLPTEIVEQGLLTHQTLFINDTLSRLNPHYRDCENRKMMSA
jgi:hypothetical protein